ncbi:acrosomal protein KIAA1210 homolog [Sorex araneus]|uniref:acrosomal protein KIAA1210 homolog n=1 Tax=Sorex araneus TaxID=42254 RepID=UPI002433737E|nr:acrosomal protein KIAA1210 homolog [Sorex araneus]
MAEAPNEVSMNIEAIEASDEVSFPGKKKFKFKALRSFFVKKKKKDSEESPSQRGRRLQSSLSSSNISISCLKAAEEASPNEPGVKTTLGSKALSHDSIFMLEPELERSTNKKYSTPETQKSIPQQKAQASRTLPRIGTVGMHGADYEAMALYSPRSGVWRSGSPIPETLVLRPRQHSTSPPIMRSHEISKDLEPISIEEESCKSVLKKTSPHKLLALKRNSSEEPSGPVCSHFLTTFAMMSSPSSTRPASFGTPATTMSHLDSSAAQHEMILNPSEYKKPLPPAIPGIRDLEINSEDEVQPLQNAPEEVVKIKQEDQNFQLFAEEEKFATKSKQDEQMKTRDYGTESISLEQCDKAELSEKTTEQDAARIPDYPSSDPIGQVHGRKDSSASGTNESESTGRCFQQSSLGLDINDETGSLPADKCSSDMLWHMFMEKSNLSPPTTIPSEATTPQELISDKDHMGGQNYSLDLESTKASAPQIMSEDVKESMIQSSPSYFGNNNSVIEKTTKETKESLLSMIDNLSANQEDDVVPMAMEEQVSEESSHFPSEDVTASSLDFPSIHFKMESVQDLPSLFKEKPTGSLFYAFPRRVSSISSALAEEDISTEEPHVTFSWSSEKHDDDDDDDDDDVFLDPICASKEGDSNHRPLTPGYSFHSTQIVPDEPEVSSDLEEFSIPPNTSEKQMSTKVYAQPIEKSQAEDILVKSESFTEEGTDSDQLLSLGYTISYLVKSEEDPGVFTESKGSEKASTPEEKLTPTGTSQAWVEAEEVFTESNSFVEKYNSAEDWSSSEEGVTSKPPSETSEKSDGQEEISSSLMNLPDKESVSKKQLTSTDPSQLTERPTAQCQHSSSSVSASEEKIVLEEPPSQPIQSEVSTQIEKQASLEITVECGIDTENLIPETILKHPIGPKTEETIISDVEIMPLEEITSVEPLSAEDPPQSSLQEEVKPEISTGTESTDVEERISPNIPLPKISPQSFVGLDEKTEVLWDAKNSLGEKTPSQSQLSEKPLVNLQCSADSDSRVKEESISDESPRLPSQSLVSPEVEPKFPIEERPVVEEKSSLVASPPKIPLKSLFSPTKQEDILSDLEEDAAKKTSPMEPVIPTYSSVEHNSQSTFAEKSKLIERLLPRWPIPPCGKSKPQPCSPPRQMTKVSAKYSSSREPLPPCSPVPSWKSPRHKQLTYTVTEFKAIKTEAQESICSETPTSEHYLKTWENLFCEHSSLCPKKIAEDWGISFDPLPPRTRSSTSVRSRIARAITSSTKIASSQWLKSEKPMPPRYTVQPWVSTKPEKKGFATAERDVEERDTPLEQMNSGAPVKVTMKPTVKQTMEACPESTTKERAIPTENLPPKQPWCMIKRKFQQASSDFESLSKEAVSEKISEKSVLPKYPIQFSVRPKVQEMSSHPGTAAVEGGKLSSRQPSQSFVKYMAQQIFSEGPSTTGGARGHPSAANKPSKFLLKSKVEHPVSSSWETADENISTKQTRAYHPLKSLGTSEDLHEVCPPVESPSAKWGTARAKPPLKPLPQALGKAENQQDEKSIEERKSSEEKKPPRYPFLAENKAGLQYQKFPKGSMSSISGAEEQLSPKNPWQVVGEPEPQQPVHSKAMGPAADGVKSEGNLSSWSLPRPQFSPSKVRKQYHSSEDILKNIHTLASKAVKFSLPPTSETPSSGSIYSKEVLKWDNGNKGSGSELSTHKNDVETLFGVRLRKTSQKYKSDKLEGYSSFPSSSKSQVSSPIAQEQQIKRSVSQGYLPTSENLTKISSFGEKPHSRHIPESMTKKQDQYKIPAKTHTQKSDHVCSEPTWMTMVRQRQKIFQEELSVKEPKFKSIDEAKVEAKYGRVGASNIQSAKKVYLSPFADTEQKMAFVKQLKSTLAAGLEEKRVSQVGDMSKEARKSATLPAKLQPADSAEPAWFSMAKKKSKAWSNISDNVQ